MSLRRDLLRLVYPAYRWLTSFTSKGTIKTNKRSLTPAVPFYTLSAPMNDGSLPDFAGLKDKKILIVNTASDCGYTAQYAELEKLYRQYIDRLVVIAFPSDDFGEQEKGTDEEIASFCAGNYRTSFLLAAKSHVTGRQCNPVFRWLANGELNGWNDHPPVWNFSKYLVNEQGVLTHYFGSAVAPATIKKLVFGVS